jgi:large subunit ribosomal protein L3
MSKSLVGSKVGMTQIFNIEKKKVIPVTAVKVEQMYVTQVKTIEKDGYFAVQLGLPKSRYIGQEPSQDWFLKKRQFFSFVKEVSLSSSNLKQEFEIGQKVSLENLGIKEGDILKVSGTSKGLGFQGVMRRHGFSGGPKSHGSTFHRAPGASGSIRMGGGEVFKGKRFPGHMGNCRVSVKCVVERVDQGSGHVFLRGSVPGKKGFLLELFAS